MQVGVIGKGNVGGTLARLWARQGHDVLLGVRDPGDPIALAVVDACGPRASAHTVREVFVRADLILLAVRWEDVPSVLAEAESLEGKTLIDCITPLERGTKRPLFDVTTSAAEQLAGMARGANVVKCLDTAGTRVMESPVIGGQAVTMFLCGDSAEAKARVWPLVADLGFECLDIGPLAAARYLEHLSALWVYLAFQQGFGKDFGFKVLQRGSSDGSWRCK